MVTPTDRNGTAPCQHRTFTAEVDVNRIGEQDAGNDTDLPNSYSADIRVRCADCNEPFVWLGVPAGLSPRHPACSVDATELRAPLRPASAPDDFGLAGPGFTIRPDVPPCGNPTCHWCSA